MSAWWLEWRVESGSVTSLAEGLVVLLHYVACCALLHLRDCVYVAKLKALAGMCLALAGKQEEGKALGARPPTPQRACAIDTACLGSV